VDRSKILPIYTSYTQTEPSDNHWFRYRAVEQRCGLDLISDAWPVHGRMSEGAAVMLIQALTAEAMPDEARQACRAAAEEAGSLNNEAGFTLRLSVIGGTV
jgi:hypothetical protein